MVGYTALSFVIQVRPHFLLKVNFVEDPPQFLIISLSHETIDHFTVLCSVTWPLNGSEAGGDLVLIQTSLLLLCKSSSNAN